MNYIKILLDLCKNTAEVLSFKDHTFPKTNDGLPDKVVLEKIKYSENFMRRISKGAGKLATQEVFKKKIVEAEELPSMELVNNTINIFRDTIDGLFDDLEAVFSRDSDQVNVAPFMVGKKWQNLTVSQSMTFF